MKPDILAGGHICLACGNYFVMPEDAKELFQNGRFAEAIKVINGLESIEAEEAKVLRI